MRFAKIEIRLSAVLFLGLCAYSGFLREAFLFLGIFLCHELGHLFWIKIFGAKVSAVHLTGIGGIIELEARTLPFWQHLLIDSGGITVNIILALIIPLIKFSPHTANLLLSYNRLLLGFNLFPVYPLDGFHLLFHGLNLFFDEEYVYDLLFYVSLLFLIVMAFLVFLSKSIGLLLVVAFLFLKQTKLKQLKKLSRLQTYRLLMPLIR